MKCHRRRRSGQRQPLRLTTARLGFDEPWAMRKITRNPDIRAPRLALYRWNWQNDGRNEFPTQTNMPMDWEPGRVAKLLPVLLLGEPTVWILMISLVALTGVHNRHIQLNHYGIAGMSVSPRHISCAGFWNLADDQLMSLAVLHQGMTQSW